MYNIAITVDECYTVDSADNRYYDFNFNPDNFHKSDNSKTLAIKVSSEDDTTTEIALIGDFYSYDSDCALLDNHIITILQNDTITQIDLTDFSITLHKKFKCFGCNYGIYRCSAGYVVYGEIEIIMLDFDFNVKWSFMGRDIFATMSEKKPFTITENRIKIYDWENNYYELDFNGQLLF